jgi:putative FmdB family regulatory protein
MPTYEYECKKCGHVYEEVLQISERENKNGKCPKCGSIKKEKLITSIQFKVRWGRGRGYTQSQRMGIADAFRKKKKYKNKECTEVEMDDEMREKIYDEDGNVTYKKPKIRR